MKDDRLDALFDDYEQGRLTRRQLAILLVGLAGSAAGDEAERPPTFMATGLDHIALSVRDVARSREFYVRHLGLTTRSQSRNSAFLGCGSQFVALFRSGHPGLAHYSYAIPDYDQRRAAERLRGAGLEPKLRGGRTYFDDPDGIEVQVS